VLVCDGLDRARDQRVTASAPDGAAPFAATRESASQMNRTSH
jgi:hypothetical protein